MSEPGNSNNHYKFSWLYHNKADSRLLVPKRNGIGKTLNWGNKWSYVIAFAVVLLMICAGIWAINYNELLNSNTGNYKFGFIYYNEKDTRIFIPRENGTGWTLNFANAWSYPFVFLILLIAVYSILRAVNQKK